MTAEQVMNVCEIMDYEHHLMLGVLDRVEQEVDCARWTVAWLQDVMAFFRDFMDGYHQVKEENGLFVRLLQRSTSLVTGPISVLHQDHIQSRDLLVQLDETLRLVAADDMRARQTVAEHLIHFIGQKRKHMQGEKEFLYPLAAELFHPADHRDIKAAFDVIQHEILGPDGEQKYEQWAHCAIHA